MRNHRTENGLQNSIRKNGTPDYVKFQGKLFTMDYYDSSGKEIYYGNMKHKLSIMVETENRYGARKFKDAIITVYEMCSYRTNINYAE